MQYGCIGERLGHSFSAQIHGMLGNSHYELCELPPASLPKFLQKKDFRGINVTIPYKEAVIPFLDSLDERAAAIGAVNTILREGDRLKGYNTDFYGMEELIRRLGVPVRGLTAAVLGTGGSSKTARAVLQHMGAEKVLRVSRRPSEEDEISYEELSRRAADIGFLVNTTPVGMYPASDASPLSLAAFPALKGVADAVYNPLCTNLVLEARSRGIPSSGGLYMLVAQAAMAASLFFSDKSLIDKTGPVYEQLLAQRRNIVLIGMPGSGKTSVGQALAARLSRPFTDSDEEFVKEAASPIPAYFEQYGEASFREAESRILQRLSGETGLVLATGGGAILREENVRALRRNGLIFFLDRNPARIEPTEDRPLSRDRTALEARYRERYPLYCRAADQIIAADGSVEEVTESILAALETAQK